MHVLRNLSKGFGDLEHFVASVSARVQAKVNECSSCSSSGFGSLEPNPKPVTSLPMGHSDFIPGAMLKNIVCWPKIPAARHSGGGESEQKSVPLEAQMWDFRDSDRLTRLTYLG
jgi:hypothetical protein